MPVVRSRAGFRVEAGRGYPRLKWSDINKSNFIADEFKIRKGEEYGLAASGVVKDPSGPQTILPEWSQRRHGVLIQSDGESEESSSDNSLIYSDFRLSPESGSVVRMAFTVPLTRMAPPQRYQNSVFQSTLQIKHKMVDTGRRLEGVKNASLGLSESSCPCTANGEEKNPKLLSSKLLKKHTKPGLEFEKIDTGPPKKVKDAPKCGCSRQSNHLRQPVNFVNGKDGEGSYVLPAGVVDSNVSPRPASFWRDLQTGRKACLASQRTRLRDATFIISPSDSEGSPSREKRVTPRKLPRNPTYVIEKIAAPPPPQPDQRGPRSLPLGLEMKDPRATLRHPRSSSDAVSREGGPSAASVPFEGQRNSSGSGAALPKRPINTDVPSPAPSQAGTPKHTSSPSAGNAAFKGKKKILKTTLRETGTRKVFQTRTKTTSGPSASNSPVSLHGRVLQKTASVSPAPPKPAANPSTPLTRFGFKSSPLITSGESTDSVNSILSDAQTVSDTNSNIFDFIEDNGNGSSDLINYPRSRINPKEAKNSRAESPCTISQASSGVTSTLLNGKLKAQTKQLPTPQVVTVKAMNQAKKKGSPPGTLKTRISSPVSRKETSPQRSPLVMPKEQRSKIPQSAPKSSLTPKPQRVSHDSESSTKSLNTVDSGLGSSSESDKLRSPALSSLRRPVPDLDSKENGFELDVSDAWLKEKQEAKGKACNWNLKFKDGPKTPASEKTPPQKETFKEKRDSNITYGMARQKFAPYSRNRLSYVTSAAKFVPQGLASSPKPDVSINTKVSSTSDSTIRSRIALMEKTPSVAPVADVPPSPLPPKKPVARPTSIEKTPILVTSKTENTVELSRSICRRLEYSEGKGSLLDTIKDNRSETHLIELPSTAQDLLMVDSFEVKKDDPLDKSVHLPGQKSFEVDPEDSECKRIKDISECENATKRTSPDPTDHPLLHLPLQDASSKVFSPDGSETSFEVLECGSADCSPRDAAQGTPGREAYLTQLVAGFPHACLDASSSAAAAVAAKHPSNNSPSRVTPLKKSRQDSDCEDVEGGRDRWGGSSSPRADSKPDAFMASKANAASAMDNSTDSSHSDAPRPGMSDSGDRWTVSGKCTPTLSSTRGDADQDFLIDDEISDQPGLTFGDDLDDSFFGDEDLFSDMSSPSASHLIHKTDRSRHESLGTTSSVGPDDLMLDYDLEETKQMGYDEEVLSPVACDILSEWSAILSDAQQLQQTPPALVASQACISQQSVGVNTVAPNSLCASLSSPLPTDINTHQPLGKGKDFVQDSALNRTNSLGSRSRTSSTGPEFCPADSKKGLTFKPPRQGASSENEGGINIDRNSLHYICQDVTAMKTLLLRLRRVIQVADTINPFDSNLKTSLYLSLGANESPEREEASSAPDFVQQNVDLKRQVVLLQQRLEEKDRSIRILQQQLSQALQQGPSPCGSQTSADLRLASSPSSSSDGGDLTPTPKPVANAATQTERFTHRASPFSLSAISRTSSIEDGLGPTVSSEPASVRGLLNDCTNLPLETEGKREPSPKKKPPSEFLVPPTPPKLSLVPAMAGVASSLVS